MPTVFLFSRNGRTRDPRHLPCVAFSLSLFKPNLIFRYADGAYMTSRRVRRGEELCISYDRDYYPGYTTRFRARESATAIAHSDLRPEGSARDS